MKIFVMNGPNLNMVGIRNLAIYGTQTFDDLQMELFHLAEHEAVELTIKQTNHEGLLIDWLQQAFYEEYDGVVLNAGAFTHYSYAIRDAIEAIAPLPVIEVHLSDIHAREAFRQTSVLSEVCAQTIMGKGFAGYTDAIHLIQQFSK